MDRKSCIVLVPIYRNLEPKTEECLYALQRLGYRVQTLRGGSQIDLVRSQMATEWLSGYSETMWIDSDIVFNPESVDKLRSHKLPFVCGLYPKKGPKEFACQWKPGTKEVVMGKGGGLLEIFRCGMGFTLIHSKVYEAIKRKLTIPECDGGYNGKRVTPYFLTMIAPGLDGKTPTILSEDYSFCARANEVGYTPYADTTISLKHIGSHEYGWDNFLPYAAGETLTMTLT